MNRGFFGLTVGVAALVWSAAADAQSAPPKPKTSGQIYAASQMLIARNEACRQEARTKKLGFLKRRLFMHECIHRKSAPAPAD